MQTIRAMIHEFISEGGAAQYATVAGAHGVLFENVEFVPWPALAYSGELGFYDVRSFPEATNTAEPAQFTIHPVTAGDGWQAAALVGEDGHAFLIGEAWQVEDLYLALGAYLHRGEGGEQLGDDAEELGHKWLSISEAVEAAHGYDAGEYPLGTATAERIRRAAQRGRLPFSKTTSGRYKFPAARFRGWLRK